MTPKNIWANLAVSNLERTTQFYTALGFKANGKPNKDLTSFLFSDANFIIHFFLKDVLAANIKTPVSGPQLANGLIFTLSAETKEEVDNWAKEVRAAGGQLISEPETFGDDYYGFTFADPDGNKFNVFYM